MTSTIMEAPGRGTDGSSSPWRWRVFNFCLNLTSSLTSTPRPEKTVPREDAGVRCNRGSPRRLRFGVRALSHCRVPGSVLSVALPEITWNTRPGLLFPGSESLGWATSVCVSSPHGGETAFQPCLQVQPVSHRSWGLGRATQGVWCSWCNHPPGCWAPSCSSNLITPGRCDYLLSCLNS